MHNKYTLFKYQERVKNNSVKFFKEAKVGAAKLLCVPTSGGKAIIIKKIVDELEGNTLILQPSATILKQNLSKFHEEGIYDLGVFSASAKSKTLEKITLGTVGSIVNKMDSFKLFDRIIIDEAHLVSPVKGTQYRQLIDYLPKAKTLGLTATPVRMHSSAMGTVCKIQTRTRPRIFTDFIDIVQMSEMQAEGRFPEFRYESHAYDIKHLLFNSTGADYLDSSVKHANEMNDVLNNITKAIIENKHNRKNGLIAVSSIEEAERLQTIFEEKGISSAVVHSKLKPSSLCEERVEAFKQGEIKFLINVTMLSVGFDYPDLEWLLLGRPITSVALFIQIWGRTARKGTNKVYTLFEDFCGTVGRYGRPETFQYVYQKGTKKLRLKGEKGYLTGIILDCGYDIENGSYVDFMQSKLGGVSKTLAFGKYAGQRVEKVPTWYLEWCVKHMNHSAVIEMFINELKRRK